MATAGQERGNPEIARSFRALGGLATKEKDLFNALKALGALRHIQPKYKIEKGGRPDYTVLLPPFGFLVEGKASPDYLLFSQFESKQRRWADDCASIAFVWIWLGKNPPHWAPEMSPREAYLLDWPSWRLLETTYEAAGFKSLPFEGPRAARTQIPQYALEWAGNNTWRIPAGHPFWLALYDRLGEGLHQIKQAMKTGAYDGSIPGHIAAGAEAADLDGDADGDVLPLPGRG